MYYNYATTVTNIFQKKYSNLGIFAEVIGKEKNCTKLETVFPKPLNPDLESLLR
jgi:hypothetical protein